MLAVSLDQDGVSLKTDYPLPRRRNDEVLVRVVRAGICETDLQLIRGYMTFRGVLGHEFVGVATEGRFAGRRVVGEINCACGDCSMCRSGYPSHCSRRSVLGILNHDGAFAEFIAVPERNLHIVPDVITTDEAVFVEPVAAAFQIPAQLRIRTSDRIVILGDGRLGNLCAQVVADLGADVLVIGKHPSKLELLRSLGIAAQLLTDTPLEPIADIVVDCTGSETGLPTALKLVRPRGSIVLKTTVAGTQTLALAPVVIDEVTIVGSRCGPFEEALAALGGGRVKVAPLISARYALSKGVEALEHTRSNPVLKVLLDIDATA